MEKLLFFRHRHVKENDELLNAFKNKLEVNKYILNKLRESLSFDFTDKNIQKTRTHFTTLIEKNHGVNFLEAYMLDDNKVVAHQLYMFDREGASPSVSRWGSDRPLQSRSSCSDTEKRRASDPTVSDARAITSAIFVILPAKACMI